MNFEFYTTSRIVFGEGKLDQLSSIGAGLGKRALLVVGARSAQKSGLVERIEGLVKVGATCSCTREPQIANVDRIVAQAQEARCDWVVAAGGGAVLDCGKAVSGMLTNPGSLLEYLEGVGTRRSIEIPAAPFVAIPTTAGTGSEVTKNAVISGEGYKKSVRSPLLIPQVALVDPQLLCGVPKAVAAACGMDALTQVIEPYLSQRANPLTDALALQGIHFAARALPRLVADDDCAKARREMSLASLLGGICLANAGLGAVHGFASPLGAFFPIPHGVACAALLPQVLRTNLEASRGTDQEQRVWSRFARVAQALTGKPAVDAGLEFLEDLQRKLEIPSLAAFGLDSEDAQAEVVAHARGSSMQYNPVQLSDEQLFETLRAAI